MIIYTPPTPPRKIPIVDLSRTFAADDQGRRDAATAIHVACRGTGFFYIVNHGLPQALIDQQFAFAKLFFDMSADAKSALDMKKSPTAAGYEPIGGQQLDSQSDDTEASPPDLKESFYCGLELPPDHPLAARKIRGLGHNQWPASLPGFKEQMLAYYAAIRSLADHVLSLVAISLDQPPDWFRPYFGHPAATLRIIKYPPHPSDAKFNQIGAGAHTDWGGITLLAQDQAGGLEVRNAAGQWIEATPIPGTFVVNVGDLLARWTNGVYMSNLHRVKNNISGGDRYSVPFFYTPNYDAIIEPIPSCVTADQPRRFETCTSSAHMAEMFRRSYGFQPGSTAS